MSKLAPHGFCSVSARSSGIPGAVNLPTQASEQTSNKISAGVDCDPVMVNEEKGAARGSNMQQLQLPTKVGPSLNHSAKKD